MSWAVWVAGAPGSNASALTRLTAARLAEAGAPPVVLDLDALCAFTAPPSTEAERETVARALVFAAAMLTETGVPVLIDASLPRRAWRDAAVASIERFAEVRLGVTAPLEGSAEGPEPDLTVDTGVTPAELAAEMIATLGLSLGPARRRPTGGGAVVWLTGPPGSGKTTLASRLADALTLDGVAFTVLEWQALRAAVLGTGWASPAGEDVAHRALVYLAKLLADTGLVVVVDATAPRRAWRALAREAIDVFAEVQLVCPLEICGDRERAVRWRPQPHPRGGVALTAPEAAVEYEVSLNPELVLDTHARSEWSAAEDVLRLTRRLLGPRPAAET